MTKMLTRACTFAVAAVSLSLPILGHAVPIQVSAGGIIDYVSGLTQAQVGDAWSLDLIYESTATDTLPENPTRAFYAGFLSFELSVGGNVLTFDQLEGHVGIDVFDEYLRPMRPPLDIFAFVGEFVSLPFGFGVNAFSSGEPPGGILSSDALLSDPEQLTYIFMNPVDGFTPSFNLWERDSQGVILGTIDRFSASIVTVPEPASVALLIPALFMLGFSARRRGS